ncbi:MAG: phosphopentomutase [Bacillota bacterium]
MVPGRKAERVVLIILDSVGIGALPDADRYGDGGSNTLGNIASQIGGINLPHMQAMGLGNIEPLPGVPPAVYPSAAYGRMAECSPGKDTTTGHWEIAGIVLEQPFPTYPEGFPEEIIDKFIQSIGRGVLGNKVASGTEIIKELGEEHLRTGNPIVYTSADSVFQVAAHEGVIPVDELYRICTIARELLRGDHSVARVIARPFIGEPGNFQRTHRRHDFSLAPPGPTLLDRLAEEGIDVMAVGKIEDIFTGRGITRSAHTTNNMEGVDSTLEFIKSRVPGLIFTNLVDFDMLYGHRNDVRGYAQALVEFDSRLPEIIAALGESDVLVLTADHGTDPTMKSTDHSREYVPLLFYGHIVKSGTCIGIRQTFADLGATVAGLLGIDWAGPGTSMVQEILRER